MSFALSVLIIVSLVLGVAGCAGTAPTAAETIKVGLITQLSGDLAALGQTVRNGVEMAVKEINDAGGAEVGGKKYKIELIVEDSEGSEEVAIAKAQKLITQDNVLAIVEHEKSQVAIPVSWVAETGKTVLIGGIASPDFTVDPQTKQAKKYIFRSTFSLNFQGPALAEFALRYLNAKRAAVLYDSESAYNRGLAEAFKKGFIEGATGNEAFVFVGSDGAPISAGGWDAGAPLSSSPVQTLAGDVVAFESYKTGDTDFTAQLNRIKAAAPDVLFMPNYLVDVPEQAKQARALGIDAQLLGPDTWAHADMLEACGSSCEGAYLTTDFRPEIPNKQAEKFIADYTTTYGSPPESPAAASYDCVGVLMQALNIAGKVDREALRDGMTRVNQYPGVTGQIWFGAGTGDPIKAANIMHVKGGVFVWDANIEP
jgi:branched-chain amino acid transport system substrate-binding protein